jgi:CSLREA domain-containing protein
MRFLGAALALALLAASQAVAGTANEITVNVFEDLPDADLGDGICDVDPIAAGSQCSLRAAIQTANLLLGGTGIQLAEGVYKLTRKRDPAEDPGTGDLDVVAASFIVVSGVSPELTVIDGRKGKDRIFDVHVAPAGLTLLDLTLRNGRTPKGDFGDTQPDQTGGGCVRSATFLDTRNVRIDHCKSLGDAGCIQIEQGGTNLTDLLLSRCKAKGDGGGVEIDDDHGLTTPIGVSGVTISRSKARGEGGALEVSGAEALLENVTFSGNKARQGGGINADDGGAVDLNNATLADNRAKVGSNLATVNLALGGGQVIFSNTVLRAKKGTSCAGVGNVSMGGNLENGSSCPLTEPTDQPDVDAVLGPLGDYGGATPTRPLLEGSPAIDRGVDGVCATDDQRGFGRVDVPGVGDATCDSGAFEYQPAP